MADESRRSAPGRDDHDARHAAQDHVRRIRRLERRRGRNDMTDMTVLAKGLRFPEGPVVLDDGAIALVEIARGTITRVAPDGAVSVIAAPGGGPNGLAVGPDGALYVCNNGGFEWHDEAGMLRPVGTPASYSGGRIERVDVNTGKVEVPTTAASTTASGGPTTSSSTATAASISRTSARCATATATRAASTTPGSTALRSSRPCIRS